MWCPRHHPLLQQKNTTHRRPIRWRDLSAFPGTGPPSVTFPPVTQNPSQKYRLRHAFLHSTYCRGRSCLGGHLAKPVKGNSLRVARLPSASSALSLRFRLLFPGFLFLTALPTSRRAAHLFCVGSLVRDRKPAKPYRWQVSFIRKFWRPCPRMFPGRDGPQPVRPFAFCVCSERTPCLQDCSEGTVDRPSAHPSSVPWVWIKRRGEESQPQTHRCLWTEAVPFSPESVRGRRPHSSTSRRGVFAAGCEQETRVGKPYVVPPTSSRVERGDRGPQ